MYGIPFGDRRERSEKLEEACAVVRGLLTDPRTTFDGEHYVVTDAPAEPKPVQPHLSLLIAGSGERRTLRTAARSGDYWSGFAPLPPVFTRKLEILAEHCAAAERDSAAFAAVPTFAVIIRDRPARVTERLEEIARAASAADPAFIPGLLGIVDEVAECFADYSRRGASGFIARMPAPYDRETVERLSSEVLPELRRRVAATPA